MKRALRYAVLASLAGCLALGAGFIPGCASQAKPAAAGDAPRTYAFWPSFPEEPRVQFLASYGSSEDVEATKTSGLEQLVFGKESAKAAAIEKPYGVAMRDGKIYVADMRGKSLVVLDLKKKQTRLLGVSGVTRLDHPVAVAVADDGWIYVADNGRGSVFVFDASERYSTVYGFEKFKPAAIAVHGDRIYAADMTSQNVVIFDRKTGKRMGVIGSVGDEDGQFRVPLGLTTDKAGNVYVVDMMRCRVQKFSPDGKLLGATGSTGDFVGSFARPKHIAVDAEGMLYVVDAAFQNVQVFDSDFHPLMHFGAAGDFPGAMNLPAGVAVCEDGADLFKDRLHPGFAPKRLLVVSNQFGPTKVVVYALGSRRPEYSAQALADSAAKIESGVGKPNEEQLKFQNPGGEEPPMDPGQSPGQSQAQPPSQPQAEPPAQPK